MTHTPGISEFIIGQDENGKDKTVLARPLGRKLHVLRCLRKAEIELPDHIADTTGVYEILSVGDKCKYFRPEHVGKRVWLNRMPTGKRTWAWFLGNNERMVREEWFEMPGGPPMMVF